MAQIEYRAATTGDVDLDKRTIELRAVPYGEEIDVMYQGRMLRERVEPGAARDIDPKSQHITLNRDHSHKRVTGRIVEMRDDAAGPIAIARVSRTPLGDETLELSRDGVLRASVAMAVAKSGMEIKAGLRRIFRIASIDHIALLPNAAYSGAEVLAVRSADLPLDVATPNLDLVLSLDGIYDLIRGRN